MRRGGGGRAADAVANDPREELLPDPGFGASLWYLVVREVTRFPDFNLRY
jgi:hypothetical protein